MQKRDGCTSAADTHCTLRLRGGAGDVEGGMLTCETWAACSCIAAELGTDELEIRVGTAATQRVGSRHVGGCARLGGAWGEGQPAEAAVEQQVAHGSEGDIRAIDVGSHTEKISTFCTNIRRQGP